MKKFARQIPLFFLVIAVVTSCIKDEDDGNQVIKAINSTIYELMQEVYLWQDHLPDLDPELYSSPEELMEDLRYGMYDKWSAVITKTEYNQYFEQGQLIGHGFLLSVDDDDNIRVAFVYRSTQAHNLGVRRSWIISRINGNAANPGNVFDLLGPATAGRTNSITFINDNGETVVLDLTKEVIDINPVLHYEVIDQDDNRIGYIVFQDFIDTAKTELNVVFQAFNAAEIDELIVDMRYNGGGSVDVAEYFSGWLIGKNYAGQPFVNFRHNEKMKYMDTTLMIPANASGLAIDRIFFIGTSSTASASELMINGVKPYLGSTILAGSTTHGKPVGMYSFPFIYYDYVVLPVTFKYTNANDEGDFYDGIPPDLEAEDDLSHDFGNPEEASLKAVLDFLAGSVPQKMFKSTSVSNRLILSEKSLNQFLKAY